MNVSRRSNGIATIPKRMNAHLKAAQPNPRIDRHQTSGKRIECVRECTVGLEEKAEAGGDGSSLTSMEGVRRGGGGVGSWTLREGMRQRSSDVGEDANESERWWRREAMASFLGPQ